jgi:hypothetical protein
MVSARSSGLICGSACWIGAVGVGQVRAGQLAEPDEVTSPGRVIGRIRGHGRHPAVSSDAHGRGWTWCLMVVAANDPVG